MTQSKRIGTVLLVAGILDLLLGVLLGVLVEPLVGAIVAFGAVPVIIVGMYFRARPA